MNIQELAKVLPHVQNWQVMFECSYDQLHDSLLNALISHTSDQDKETEIVRVGMEQKANIEYRYTAGEQIAYFYIFKRNGERFPQFLSEMEVTVPQPQLPSSHDLIRTALTRLASDIEGEVYLWYDAPVNPVIGPLPSPSKKDSGKHRYPSAKRRQIVQHYRRARAAGLVTNKVSWAEEQYKLSSKTLARYEKEFPEDTSDT